MGFLGDLSPIEQQLVVAGAKLAAAVALVAILRFSKAPLLSVQVFKVVTPVLILLLFGRALCAGALPARTVGSGFLLAFRCNELAVLH